MTDRRYMDITEFRESGFLQEANRLFFHPHGLALEVVVDADGTERLGGIWDERGDNEGIVFDPPPDLDKARTVATEWKRHARHRMRLFDGPVCQPPGPQVVAQQQVLGEQ